MAPKTEPFFHEGLFGGSENGAIFILKDWR